MGMEEKEEITGDNSGKIADLTWHYAGGTE
jgi:hypothetical protein